MTTTVTPITQDDLALIRDEVGTDEPTDSELRREYLSLNGSWLLVAIRVLKRRRAAATSGGVSTVSIPGAISVTLSVSQISALDAQIAELQAKYDASQGTSSQNATFGCLVRRLPR